MSWIKRSIEHGSHAIFKEQDSWVWKRFAIPRVSACTADASILQICHGLLSRIYDTKEIFNVYKHARAEL